MTPEEELLEADEACASDDDLEDNPFTSWLEDSDHGDLDFSWKTFTLEHLEAAFWAGEQTGFDRATEYYRTGGSFK